MNKILKPNPMDQWMIDDIYQSIDTIRKNLNKVKALSHAAENLEYTKVKDQLLDLIRISIVCAENLKAHQIKDKKLIKEYRDFEKSMRD